MAVDVTHALRNELISTAAVTAIVSTRIYTDQAPSILSSSVLPQVVLEMVDMDRLRHTDGVDHLARAEITIHCWGDVRADLVDLMAAIRNALDHFRGTLGSSETADCFGIFFTETRIERTYLQDGAEYGPFHGEHDVTIRFGETVS